MKVMSQYPEFVEEFNTQLADAHAMCCITRDAQLQSEAIDSMLELQSRLSSFKTASVEQGKEDIANSLLGYECATQTLISELRMYLLLKQERPDDAWDELINAQVAAQGAIRAHSGFSHLEHRVRQLELIEKLVFPPQVYLSVGVTLDEVECSICNASYHECDHVKGRPYMGELCGLIITKASLNEVSFVEEPADKRCRVTHIHYKDGKKRNRMTWQFEEERLDEQESNQ